MCDVTLGLDFLPKKRKQNNNLFKKYQYFSYTCTCLIIKLYNGKINKYNLGRTTTLASPCLIYRSSGVNFINVLSTAFALVDPESVKIQLSHQCLLT